MIVQGRVGQGGIGTPEGECEELQSGCCCYIGFFYCDCS